MCVCVGTVHICVCVGFIGGSGAIRSFGSDLLSPSDLTYPHLLSAPHRLITHLQMQPYA